MIFKASSDLPREALLLGAVSIQDEIVRSGCDDETPCSVTGTDEAVEFFKKKGYIKSENS